MEGDDPCSWIDETQLTCARTALKEFKDKESQKKAGVKPAEQVLAVTVEEGSIINALITGSDDGIPRKITGVTIKENPKLAAEAQEASKKAARRKAGVRAYSTLRSVKGRIR